MPAEFRHRPSPAFEGTAKACPLLDSLDNRDAWGKCRTKWFLAIAQCVARDDDLAQDAFQESWVRVFLPVCEYRDGTPARGGRIQSSPIARKFSALTARQTRIERPVRSAKRFHTPVKAPRRWLSSGVCSSCC